MIIIGAMTRDHVIGSGAGMPWDVPEEYAHFQRLVAGETIVIGRRSYEIFGESLTSAHTLVVSRSGREMPGALVVPTLDDALRKAPSFGRTVFVAGGASIYEQTVPRAEAMYLSYIEGDFAGDAYFPTFDERHWRVERREVHPRFEFVVYRRSRVAGSGRASSSGWGGRGAWREPLYRWRNLRPPTRCPLPAPFFQALSDDAAFRILQPANMRRRHPTPPGGVQREAPSS